MQKIKFSEILIDNTKFGTKIQKEDYLDKGKFPIIDQGQQLIGGYCNDENFLYKKVPCIIFGDHTRIIKYFDEPFYLGADGVKILNVVNKNFNTKYIYYHLKNKYIPNTGYNRHFKFLKEFDFNYYDLPTQEKIVRELDKINEIIDKKKQQLADLDTLIKSQFTEMFGDPFHLCKYKQKKLKEISISISDGSNIEKSKYQKNGEIIFFRIQNVWSNELKLNDIVFISEDVNKHYFDTSLQYGDILITKIGRYYTKDSSLGRVSIYHGENNKANYSNNIMRIRLNSEVKSEFVNYLLNLDKYNKYIRKISIGGTDKRALSKSIIENFPIIMPPIELQNKFADFVQKVENTKSKLKENIKDLETLLASRMQHYFGE